jgi:HlyD family secretion protein
MLKFLLPCLLLLTLSACNNDDRGIALGTLERDRIAHSATVSEVIIQLSSKQPPESLKGKYW